MKKVFAILCLMAGAAITALAAPPQYPGGEKAMNEFIAKNLQYPAMAMENGVEGVVELSVAINPDGTIGTIKVTRMVDPDLEQEAIRIVKKMPNWIPGDNAGTANAETAIVKISFSLPDPS